MKIKEIKKKIIKELKDETEIHKEMKIIFRNPNVDTEEVRECLEDGLGVEILEIAEGLIT